MAEGPASDPTAGGDATTETETNAGTPAADREGESRVFVSGEARRDAAARTLGLAAGVLGLSGALVWRFPGLTDPAWMRAELADLGALAPPAFVALQALQVVLAPVPGQVLGGIGGYLFGTLAGTLLSMVGVAVGSALVFLASDRFGRPYVERALDPTALSRWDGFVERHGAAGLFALFLLPAFPDDLLCFVAGLSELRLRGFLVIVLVGRTPTFVAASYAGTRLADGRPVAFAGVVIALAAVSVLVYLGRERVDRAAGRNRT
ncbi:TVP38/TMEM64 family protein [Halobacteriales archaeon QS_5_68_33]|nr:MAG: TVP38/TMEM64 family protein [Halobacteriales archaeon QS_5_68_33]